MPCLGMLAVLAVVTAAPYLLPGVQVKCCVCWEEFAWAGPVDGAVSSTQLTQGQVTCCASGKHLYCQGCLQGHVQSKIDDLACSMGCPQSQECNSRSWTPKEVACFVDRWNGLLHHLMMSPQHVCCDGLSSTLASICCERTHRPKQNLLLHIHCLTANMQSLQCLPLLIQHTLYSSMQECDTSSSWDLSIE